MREITVLTPLVDSSCSDCFNMAWLSVAVSPSETHLMTVVHFVGH